MWIDYPSLGVFFQVGKSFFKRGIVPIPKVNALMHVCFEVKSIGQDCLLSQFNPNEIFPSRTNSLPDLWCGSFWHTDEQMNPTGGEDKEMKGSSNY